MQIVAVDIGNSSTKIAVEHPAHDVRWSQETIIRGTDPISYALAKAVGNSALDSKAIPLESSADISDELDLGDQAAFWSVSSVNQTRQQQLANWVSKYRPQDRFHIINPHEVDLETAVPSRDRLGRDRLIGTWQAIQLNETGPVIVIDAGTAVTIDVVDDHPRFLGGVIFPGASLMLKMLAQQTDALPDLSQTGLHSLSQTQALKTKLSFVGQSTEDAILLGVYQTQICTMKTAVKKLSKRFPSRPEVFVTGGGMFELLPWLPENWTHVPDMVLQGALNIGRRLSQFSTSA